MELLNLVGQRFGRLVVLERAENRMSPNKTVRTMWRCMCDCGNVVERSSQNLRTGENPSCGCYKNEQTSKRRLIDLTGMRFGRLTVVERSDNAKAGQAKWLCKCDCGNECIAYGSNLQRGHTISCGCYREEIRPSLRQSHGYSNTRIYKVYEKIKGRCYNPNTPCYPRYGGRGITMCEEWLKNPESFIEWAYENDYDEDAEYGKCTIDRIDNNKGYSPENCRIVDAKEQANNRRTNLIIEHNGERKTLAQWRDYFGMTQWQAYKNFVIYKRTVQDVIDKGIV